MFFFTWRKDRRHWKIPYLKLERYLVNDLDHHADAVVVAQGDWDFVLVAIWKFFGSVAFTFDTVFDGEQKNNVHKEENGSGNGQQFCGGEKEGEEVSENK